jgi:hypothetical protein
MNKSFRTHAAAAAILLLPLASAFAASPAAARHAVVAQPALQALSVQSNGGLAPGAVLRLQLLGTPGAHQASASLGESGVRVALREQSPGRYAGTYTVRRTDRIDPLQTITARASFGGRPLTREFRYPAGFEALARARHDDRPPVVSQLAPANGQRFQEQGRTFIRARLDDAGTGVDVRSVRLVVDGLDVTRDARISDDEIAYRERLGRGEHHAMLVVRDRSGNVNRTAWSFRVV